MGILSEMLDRRDEFENEHGYYPNLLIIGSDFKDDIGKWNNILNDDEAYRKIILGRSWVVGFKVVLDQDVSKDHLEAVYVERLGIEFRKRYRKPLRLSEHTFEILEKMNKGGPESAIKYLIAKEQES